MFVKKTYEIEHMYSLADKKQFFLGRKDDPDNLNQVNLGKVIKIIDKNFDKQLEKYLIDFNEHISYMIKKNEDIHYNKRLSTIIKNRQIRSME